MACCISAFDLPTLLEQHCEKICKPKGTVLFRRGEKAFGVLLVLSGRVSLDAGIDKVPARSYGAGALVGLPATLTKANYSMTAPVTEDAELGFLSPQTLDSLMQDDPRRMSGATDIAERTGVGDSASAKGTAPQGEAACVGGTPCVLKASSVP